MTHSETAATFDCEGERLVGVIDVPEPAAPVGVVIVVGGPQYRVGSHRQFVQLARCITAAGYAVIRFDYRGMGDSTGPMRSFEDVAPDIHAAIRALQAHCPAVKRIVLWGLCDGASGALLYCEARHDARVAGMALVNPWVRADATFAKTQLKHYYGRRLFSRAFWSKLVHGGVNVADSVRSLAASARIARTGGRSSAPDSRSFQDRMRDGLRSFGGPVLVVLSSDDLTAREFVERTQSDADWCTLLGRANVEQRDLAGADHTFSSKRAREAVESVTVAWLRDRFPRGS